MDEQVWNPNAVVSLTGVSQNKHGFARLQKLMATSRTLALRLVGLSLCPTAPPILGKSESPALSDSGTKRCDKLGTCCSNRPSWGSHHAKAMFPCRIKLYKAFSRLKCELDL